MNIIYIISLIILIVIFYPLQKHARYLFSNWRIATDTSSKFVCILALATSAFALLLWVFLIYWTLSSWLISLEPTKPKPYFLIMYVLGLFSLGISMGLSQMFSGINSLKNDNNLDSEKD
jgi:hypothetical protein